MTNVIRFLIKDWNRRCPDAMQQEALGALEEGNVLFLPQLGFSLSELEARFLSPATGTKSKNISLDVATGTLCGCSLGQVAARPLRAMMQRFEACSNDLMLNLFPYFQAELSQGRTSFRPVEIVGRSTSWRKDDTRLHIDSFPSVPVRDKRILRVFCNVNPEGWQRTWRLGESFEKVASRFLPFLLVPAWGSSQLLRLFRITKSRRSAYDHLMLQLHDRMKADLDYQASADQITYDFPAGSTWIAFTDQVSHASMTGQYLLEQTFYLPVAAMMDPSKSPLRVLERLTGRKLT
ncbi:MAG: Kdo hydroxylase family protein [Methylococcales bacterium]